MTYWHEPAVLVAEDCSPIFRLYAILDAHVALLGSCSHQVYACFGWHIHVSYIHLTFR
jgi:hypothetical protein